MTGSPPELTVLLPCFNEENAVGVVIDELRAVLDRSGHSYEVLVVDDASTDRTAEIAAKHGATILRRELNGGSGAARKTGIRAARSERIVMLDADGTYPPTAIPQMVEMLARFDQVNGARTSEQGTLKWLRAPTKWLIGRLASYLTARPIPDLNTGLKVFRRSVMLPYLHLMPDGFSCVSTMTLAFLVNDHPTTWLPIDYRPRIGHSKFRPIRDTSAYLQTVLRMVLYFKPLKIFLPAGTFLCALGMLLSVYHRAVLGHMLASDIVVLSAALATLGVGLLADLIVVHSRRPLLSDDRPD